MTSALGSAVDFLKDFGFFDVILPFLLVFTIIFGILEKTRVFGVEKVGGNEYPKKNLNSMVAFVIAFFTIAAKEIVYALQVSLPKVALVLTIVISFMLLAGSFMSDKEFNFEKRTFWKVSLTILMFIAIILIFLDAFDYLNPIIAYIGSDASSVAVPLVLIGVIFGSIAYIVGGKSKNAEGSSGGSDE